MLHSADISLIALRDIDLQACSSREGADSCRDSKELSFDNYPCCEEWKTFDARHTGN